ncbi:SIMPL domain-containing protein [[Empedobacter] haloabium]|uniref:SIMPL domain-containing protein n=1 Tax=[Empedobacter] haloabium TaxID=592317 RepID=A0ABZ1UJC8_9BURK
MMRSIVVAGIAALLAMPAAGAAELPSYPLVSTAGKAQAWLPPDQGELQFETGAQHTSAEAASAALGELSTTIATLLAQHGVADADVDSAELAKKTVGLSKPAADGATSAYVLTRHYRVQVRELARWPALVAALLATEHVDSLGVSFDRSDSEQLNRDLLRQAADDARANGTALARSFGRKLGPAMAITRGPLDKLSAPFIAQAAGGETLPRAPAMANYAVPPSIPFAQSVTAIFRLQ